MNRWRQRCDGHVISSPKFTAPRAVHTREKREHSVSTGDDPFLPWTFYYGYSETLGRSSSEASRDHECHSFASVFIPFRAITSHLASIRAWLLSRTVLAAPGGKRQGGMSQGECATLHAKAGVFLGNRGTLLPVRPSRHSIIVTYGYSLTGWDGIAK